jgi:hypothetical protein
MNIMQQTVQAVGKTYKIALSILPGVGAADGSKTAIEEAQLILKQRMTDIIKKMYKMPQTIVEQISNIKVDEKAML